jgi:PhnB protein
MKAINPYLNFNGQTREAMTFYAKNLGAKLEIQSFKDAGIPGPDENRTMHAKLAKGSLVIMASDTPMSMPAVNQGNNIWISVDCTNVAEIEKLFAAFSEGGRVTMPLADQFWGAKFGMIVDKYGVGWMFNCQLPKPKPKPKAKAKAKPKTKAKAKAAKKRR